MPIVRTFGIFSTQIVFKFNIFIQREADNFTLFSIFSQLLSQRDIKYNGQSKGGNSSCKTQLSFFCRNFLAQNFIIESALIVIIRSKGIRISYYELARKKQKQKQKTSFDI